MWGQALLGSSGNADVFSVSSHTQSDEDDCNKGACSSAPAVRYESAGANANVWRENLNFHVEINPIDLQMESTLAEEISALRACIVHCKCMGLTADGKTQPFVHVFCP